MKKLKILLLALPLLLICNMFFCGFAAETNITQAKGGQGINYFTIHYNNQRIDINDKMLKPNWFNAESQAAFVKGRTLYERIDEVNKEPKKNVKKENSAEKQLQKNFPELHQIVAKIQREVTIEAFDGNIHFDPEREPKFWVTNAREGCKLDSEKLCFEILSALISKKHADIIASVTSVKPRTEKEILNRIGLRASYSTKFDSDNLGRSENIERSINCFNGLTVASGEEISFNKTVGARTAERGYEEAKIILDGEFVNGIGGGVCQTSTTIFNAALLSGLRIAESHNHSLPISYVPLGRDAMVSSAVDLVLENNTGAPIYIEAGIEGNRVFAKVYGSKLNGLVYKPSIEVTEKPIKEKIEGTVPKDLKTNSYAYNRIVIEKGEPVRVALTYLEIYKGDRLVNKKLIRKSTYKGNDEVVRYEKIKTPPAGNESPALIIF